MIKARCRALTYYNIHFEFVDMITVQPLVILGTYMRCAAGQQAF